MAVTERPEFIIALCHEAGDTGHSEVLVEDWEANHACCCALHLERAAQGDTKTLNTIRACMGLPEVRRHPLAGGT
jgi:hypothetical protein